MAMKVTELKEELAARSTELAAQAEEEEGF